MNSYIYLVGLVIVAILLVVLVKKYDESYIIMNLGNYGKEVPSICYEDTPVDSTCRACSLSCPDPTNCNQCKQRTMCLETEPVKDTAGYPAVCNSCHVSCRNPEECFECRRKLVLPGVL